MKKQSIWSKPITWGGYAKFSIIVTLVSFAIAGIELVCMFTNIPSRIKGWFESKFHKETEYEDVE